MRTKLSLYSGLLVLGVVSSVGVSLYLVERFYLIQRLQQSQAEIVQFLAQIGRETIVNKSDLLLSSYLALIHRSRALTYAMVLNDKGQVLAHSNVILVGQKLTDPLTQKALETRSFLRQEVGASGDQLVDLSLPIYMEGRRVGTARVGYSQNLTKQLVDQTLEAARHRIIAATAISLLLGLLGAVLLSYYIARPIQHLRDGARQIGEGALDHRIEITSRDELGELAEEFNIMAAKLQELDRMKQDFVSNVTHELRSPLTSLRGYVEFLIRGDAGPLNDDQKEQLIVVKNNAIRLGRFIDNLLDVSKIEAREVEIHPEALSLRDMAAEMKVLFRPQAQEKKILFKEEVPDKIPNVWADADKLTEILTNLLSNAFKFTPEHGCVTLSAREEGDDIHVSVKDTGVGIPPASLNSVFNKFEQIQPTEGLVRKVKGTGLGLTIVKGFV
ncbi:MAG: HAMP domain-containing protein, partial [Elusimicrobia bacterium]|nr:HAMP domain-containing protein [Elusimicrobiota bacterium]